MNIFSKNIFRGLFFAVGGLAIMKLFEGGNLEKLMESLKSLTNPVQNSSQPVADKTVADAQSPSPDAQNPDSTAKSQAPETNQPSDDPHDLKPGDHVTPSQTPAPTPVEDQNLEPPLKTTQPSQGGRG